MVSCPSSIAIIDGWVPPLAEYLRYGGVCGLGSDQACGNNNQSILSELKVAALLNKVREKNAAELPAWKMLRLATIEGAKAVGLGDFVGSIEPGKRADWIVFDLDRATLVPLLSYPIRNLAHNIVYAARGEEIVYVIVEGQIVKEGNQIKIMNEKAALKEVQGAAEDLARAGGGVYLDAESLLVKEFKRGLF